MRAPCVIVGLLYNFTVVKMKGPNKPLKTKKLGILTLQIAIIQFI